MKTIICEKCGAEYNEELGKCPVCALFNNEKENKPSAMLNMHWCYSLALFLIGSFGLPIIAFKLSHIFAFEGHSPYYSGLINFTAYFILFAFLFTGVIANLDEFKKHMKGYEKYLYGLVFGIGVLFGSIMINIIINIFYTLAPNENESAIRNVISLTPLLSVIVFGLIGPICEELTYRAGLFTLISKKNKILAYIVTILVFGFIHFDYQNITSINEWLNLPIYCFSGFLFTLAYDKYGLPGSIVAHMTNNLVSVLMNLLN